MVELNRRQVMIGAGLAAAGLALREPAGAWAAAGQQDPVRAMATQATPAMPPSGCGFLNLGVLPIYGVTTAGTVLDATYPGGPRIYSVTSIATPPALFGVRDALTGAILAELPMPNSYGSWAIDVAPDHSVYVGSYSLGHWYRYDPATNAITDLGVAVAGETFVWTVAVAPDGTVYGGTSGGGHLVRYDPATGATTDLGQPVPGEQFIRDLGIGPDGTVYAGMGSVSMKVAVVAPDGRVLGVIDPPEGVGPNGWAYDVDVIDRYLLVRYESTAGVASLGVYDLARRSWRQVLPEITGLTIGGGRHGHHLYLIRGNTELVRYDLRSGEVTGTGFSDFGGGGIRILGLLEVPGERGPTLVGTSSQGGIWHYHLRSRTGRFIEPTLTGTPVTIRALAAGPDNRVYASGYFTGGMAAYDPATGEAEEFRGIGQLEGMVSHQGKLYLGQYPHAQIHVYDPTQPWQPGSNPRKILDLRSAEQSRPFAWTSAGDLVAFGTVPAAGAIGGALGIYDPATGQARIRRDIIPRHSIIGLAYRDGIVYGTTSTWGGTNQPQDTAAVVFAYDLASDTVLWRTAPVPGDLALGSIVFDDVGHLWGLTPDALFELDPATGTTLRYHKFGTYPWDSVDHVWLDTFIVFHRGLLWGKVQSRAYRIDRAGPTMTQIVRPVSNLALGPDGHLYLSRNENFYTYRIC